MKHVDPEAVVSPVHAQVLDVLPRDAGLNQLVSEGKLTRVTNAHRKFRIERYFPYFPAGLTGAFGTNFVLPKGVEMPGGSLGHSCVTDEETGRSLAGMGCQIR